MQNDKNIRKLMLRDVITEDAGCIRASVGNEGDSRESVRGQTRSNLPGFYRCHKSRVLQCECRLRAGREWSEIYR